MSSPQRRYLLLEQGIGAGVVNFAINFAIAWLMFRDAATVPLWGQQSIGADTLGTAFVLPFLSTLIVTRLARVHVRRGRVAALGWSRGANGVLRWLPASTTRRALYLGVAGVVAAGLPATQILDVLGVAAMERSTFLYFKATFAAVLAMVVTPVIALWAIAET